MSTRIAGWVASFLIASVGLASPVFAQIEDAGCDVGLPVMPHDWTVNARCELYPAGEDKASAVAPCTFSQHQWMVTITLENGTNYELSPSPTEFNSFTDSAGRPALRELLDSGNIGQIYRLADQSIYVYWDTAGISE